MSRDPVVGRRKGLQPCSLVIGARDDSFAGDLCCGGLYLRGRGGDPSLRAAGNDYRRRARRLGGGAGGDGDTLGSPVFGPRRQTLARLVSASALPIAVQPQAASARTDDRFGAAAGREADRQKRAAARRRHPDRGRQLPRLREPQRLCRHRRLRLLPVQEPVFVGRAACPCHRPRRLPLGYTLVAANEKEYEPVRELTTAHKGCTLIADKGLWGREYAQTLALQEVTILTPERTRNASNLERERQAWPAAARDRVDHLQPQMPNAPRAPPRQDTRRAGAADRPAAARAHDRHAPQHPHRPPTPSARRL